MDLVKIDSLKFENISFAYEGQDALFEQVDFDFPMNQMVWVRAPSGAGRSTLLQLIAGLQLAQKGNYLINEANVNDMSFEEFLPYRLAIGYAFDLGGVIHNRTMLENVTLPLLYHKILPYREAQDRALHYFNELGITKYKDQRPSMVSGGVRKATCLIRALITHPQVLLLDDPSVGLGQEIALKFFDLVQELRKQEIVKHIFVSSYDEKFMGLLEHQEIFIDHGCILKELHEEKKVVSL